MTSETHQTAPTVPGRNALKSVAVIGSVAVGALLMTAWSVVLPILGVVYLIEHIK